MSITEDIARIRRALCDPAAPWYGSDLVPLVDDAMTELERLRTALCELICVYDVHANDLVFGTELDPAWADALVNEAWER